MLWLRFKWLLIFGLVCLNCFCIGEELIETEETDTEFDNHDDCGDECEKKDSWELVLLLTIIILLTLIIYVLLLLKVTYIPESLAVIALGMGLGGIAKLTGKTVLSLATFPPETFFLFLLPPIIFDSGYSLHKGNFFQNLGSILVYAVLGTMLSTAVVGTLVFLIGYSFPAQYSLSLLDSLLFASLISAVDPVATLAVFHALHVDPLLYILVFGESVLNDAVAIVIFRTLLEFQDEAFTAYSVLQALGQFVLVSLGSVVIGVITALESALMFKYTNLKAYPSLEITIMLIFCYLPYLIAEGLDLSGIMAILFCGIVMAHYTHFNLSPTSQIVIQQVFRVLAFVSENAVFIYLGSAVFSYSHTFSITLVVTSIVAIVLGRAVNIYPLTALVNRFRDSKISSAYQFVMWFSGLRGAIAFALAITLTGPSSQLIITTTLSVVLFTLIFFGGGTLPVLRFTGIIRNQKANIAISKTEEMGGVAAADESYHEDGPLRLGMTLFERLDNYYLKPVFRTASGGLLSSGRTSQELQSLSTEWDIAIDDEDDEDEDSFQDDEFDYHNDAMLDASYSFEE